MKPSICFLFALTAVALTAFAAPSLLVETSITQYDARGNARVLAMPTVVVTDGKQAVVQIGNLECAVTPTMLDTGDVVAQFVVTQRDDGQAKTIAAPRITTPLNQFAEIKVGDVSIKTKVSLPK